MGGVVGLRGNSKGEVRLAEGKTKSKKGIEKFIAENEYLDATTIDYRYHYGIRGGRAEVIKKDVLQRYPFPKIDGEKFMPESYLWFSTAKDGYKFRWFNKVIYFTEFLDDGLTKKHENSRPEKLSIIRIHSQSEAASAMEYMAMAGWKTSDMLGGIECIMNLAAASGEDLATTSDIVTDALTAFGLSASDSGHFADILAAASSNANTNVSMMGETFKYCAPIAGALGFSAEDTAEAIGLMANSGIKASQAGTSLRSIMNNLACEVTFGFNQKQLAGFHHNHKIRIMVHKCIEAHSFSVDNSVPLFDVIQPDYYINQCVFSDTQDGARATAIAYSIMNTAKFNGLRVFEYLEYLLDTMYRTPKKLLDLNKLLPWSQEMQAAFRME